MPGSPRAPAPKRVRPTARENARRGLYQLERLALRHAVFAARRECRSLSGEAVKQAVAARAPQIFLAAASAGVHRVPRCVTATHAVVMTDLGTARAATHPVLAGVVGAIGISPAVCLRAREHIVRVACVPGSLYRVALLGKHGHFSDTVAETCLL